MNPAIAIFVKTPGLSPIKTRLAQKLGRVVAEACYRRAAACVAIAASATRLPVYWAVAEENGMHDPLWRKFPRLHQGDGGLGGRMSRVHGELVRRHGAGMLIGADLPQIEVGQLAAAAAWLETAEHRHVLGPARDGGFWLFGANRSHPTSIWESVGYSREDTARRFIAAIDARRWKMLNSRTDLDRADDLVDVLDELESLPAPSAEQRALARWIAQRLDRAA